MRSTALAKIVVGVELERRKARSPWLDFFLAIGFGGGWDAIRGILDADR